MPKTRNEINIGYKECSLCKIYLPISKFRIRKNYYPSGKDCIVSRCRSCELEANKRTRSPEKRREYERKRFADKERRIKKNEFQRKWREKNIIKNRNYHKKNIKKNVDQLSNSYVSRTMYRRKYGQNIPEELIEVKREQLRLKRLIKEKYGKK